MKTFNAVMNMPRPMNGSTYDEINSKILPIYESVDNAIREVRQEVNAVLRRTMLWTFKLGLTDPGKSVGIHL